MSKSNPTRTDTGTTQEGKTKSHKGILKAVLWWFGTDWLWQRTKYGYVKKFQHRPAWQCPSSVWPQDRDPPLPGRPGQKVRGWHCCPGASFRYPEEKTIVWMCVNARGALSKSANLMFVAFCEANLFTPHKVRVWWTPQWVGMIIRNTKYLCTSIWCRQFSMGEKKSIQHFPFTESITNMTLSSICINNNCSQSQSIIFCFR